MLPPCFSGGPARRAVQSHWKTGIIEKCQQGSAG